MLNPEYYVGEYHRPDGSWATAKFADQVWAGGVGTSGSRSLMPVSCKALASAAGVRRRSSVPLSSQLDEAVPEGGESRFAERRPLLLVPVPAESDWAAAPRAADARAALAALRAAAGDAGATAAKRQREEGMEEAGDVSMSMMVSDATGQTTADDGDSAASRARRAAAVLSAGRAAQEASSGTGATGADLPPGCCMAYVSHRPAQWQAGMVGGL